MNKSAYTCFQVEFCFWDGVPASVCGFCRRERQVFVETCFQGLSELAFGNLQEGLLIDRRFVRLLAEAAESERGSMLLLAGCVKREGADGPCGAVLGDVFAPPESAREDCTGMTLPDGPKIRLLLRPGIGAVAFWAKDRETEESLYADLTCTFPSEAAQDLLYRQAEGFLWATDYQTGHLLLNGDCKAWMRDES